MTLSLTREAIARLFPRATARTQAELYESQAGPLSRFQITKTKRRLAYFLAQAAEESGGFSVFSENLNYTRKRAHEVWPSRFPATTSTERMDPKALAIKVYGGRMGNAAAPSEDGWTYRGRGPIQLTGRGNYRDIGRFLGLNLEANPDLVTDPDHMMLVQAGYWAKNDLNRFADAGDFRGLTRAINGGLTNLELRQEWLRKVEAEMAKPGSLVEGAALPQSAPVAPVPPPPDVPAPEPAAPVSGGFWASLADLFRRLFGRT